MQNTEDTDHWDTVSLVVSGRYRQIVLEELNERPLTPSAIASRADVGIAHISRALQTLRDEGLVDLMVSEDRKKGRIYQITERGENVWESVAGMDG